MAGKMTSPTTVFTMLLVISTTCAQRAEVVHTTLGPIQGLRKTVLKKQVDVYYGIPFAKPPLGELRFKPPEAAEAWTKIRSTTTKPNACFQSIDTAFDRFPGVEMWNPNTPMSEDCLYLNVWVPRESGSQLPKTTMVWIHGGGFYAGSSALDVYDGSKLAVTQNVIVASMNYRLGPLGFLYTGIADAPGNQGLLDQSLALKWIYDNVASFGGQQSSITLFGESAGSISVGMHLMSPLSMKYFTRAIMQSGATSDRTYMSRSKATKRAQKLAGMFNCPLKSIKMVHCLRQVGAENITSAQWALRPPGRFSGLPLTPVVDKHFLKDRPQVLLAKGAVKETELLIGVNKDEGMHFLLYGFPKLFPLDSFGNISDAEFKKIVRAFNYNAPEKLDKAIIYEYMDRVVPAKRDFYHNVAADILGDSRFICPTGDFATAFASLKGKRAVYLYSFQHRLSNTPWPEWTGVMHGYEIEAVFGLPQAYHYTEEEKALAGRMTGYWARFAQNGNPNEGRSHMVWPKLTPQDQSYLKLTAKGDTVDHGLRYEQCTFWSTIMPMLTHDTTTRSPECQTNGQGTAAASIHRILLFSLCVTFFFSFWLLI